MSDVHILAIALARRSFRVCGTDRAGGSGCPDFARGFFRFLLQHGTSIGRVSGPWSRPEPRGRRYARVHTGSKSFVLEPRD
jgi:hypothetical protein